MRILRTACTVHQQEPPNQQNHPASARTPRARLYRTTHVSQIHRNRNSPSGSSNSSSIGNSVPTSLFVEEADSRQIGDKLLRLRKPRRRVPSAIRTFMHLHLMADNEPRCVMHACVCVVIEHTTFLAINELIRRSATRARFLRKPGALVRLDERIGERSNERSDERSDKRSDKRSDRDSRTNLLLETIAIEFRGSDFRSSNATYLFSTHIAPKVAILASLDRITLRFDFWCETS